MVLHNEHYTDTDRVVNNRAHWFYTTNMYTDYDRRSNNRAH